MYIGKSQNSQRKSNRVSSKRKQDNEQIDNYEKRKTNKFNKVDEQKQRGNKLTQIRKDKKEEKKNTNKQYYEGKKRKMSSTTDEDLKEPQKKM